MGGYEGARCCTSSPWRRSSPSSSCTWSWRRGAAHPARHDHRPLKRDAMSRIRKHIPGIDPEAAHQGHRQAHADRAPPVPRSSAASARSRCSPAATSATASETRADKVSRFNDRAQAWLFDPNGSRPTYPESDDHAAVPVQRLLRRETRCRDVDEADYKLEVGGLVDEQEAAGRCPSSTRCRRRPDHAPHLRRGLERDRQVERRALRRLPAARRRRH